MPAVLLQEIKGKALYSGCERINDLVLTGMISVRQTRRGEEWPVSVIQQHVFSGPNCVPEKDKVKSSLPGSVNVTLFRIGSLQMWSKRSYGSRGPLNPGTGVILRRRKFGHRDTGQMFAKMKETKCWRQVWSTRSPPELEDAMEDSSLGLAAGASPVDTLVLTLWPPEL